MEAPAAAIAWRTPSTLCAARLSSTTTSPGSSAGASNCSTPAYAGAGSGAERGAVDRAIEHHGGENPRLPEAGDQGRGAPMAMRPGRAQTPIRRAATIAPRHVGGGAVLVEKDEPPGVHEALPAAPPPAL